MTLKIPIRIIPLEANGFHLFIDAALNGKNANMLVDTGASKTVFDINRILKFTGKRKKTFKLFENHSTGLGTNTMESHFTTIKEFCVSGLKLNNYNAILLDMSHVNQSYKMLKQKAIDGVLGSDLLMKYKAVIDYKNMVLKLQI